MKLNKIRCYLGIHKLKLDENSLLRLRCSICNNYCDYDGGVF